MHYKWKKVYMMYTKKPQYPRWGAKTQKTANVPYLEPNQFTKLTSTKCCPQAKNHIQAKHTNKVLNSGIQITKHPWGLQDLESLQNFLRACTELEHTVRKTNNTSWLNPDQECTKYSWNCQCMHLPKQWVLPKHQLSQFYPLMTWLKIKITWTMQTYSSS